MEEKKGINPKDLLVSIFKYSIATWVNFIIYGASLLLVAWFIPADTWGQLDIFISTSTLIMNICILGLDQSFMRFFNEPPTPLDKKSLLGNCFGISAICLAVTAVICCVFFPQQVLGVFFSEKMPSIYLAYLFVNAFMAMIGRYVNLVYRMSGSIKLYTLESVLMQFFTKVFFVLGVFVSNDLNTLILFAVGGMTAFGLVFLFVIRRDITVSPAVIFTKANRQILPYGLALMPTAVMLAEQPFQQGLHCQDNRQQSGRGVQYGKHTVSGGGHYSGRFCNILERIYLRQLQDRAGKNQAGARLPHLYHCGILLRTGYL